MGADLYMNPPLPECRTKGCRNHPSRCEECAGSGAIIREKNEEIGALTEQLFGADEEMQQLRETLAACRRLISAWNIKDPNA